MGLGFENEGGAGGNRNFTPRLKWDAKAGDMIRIDRYENASGDWENDETEVALPMKAVMDLGNIEVGWLSFAGSAPDFQMVKVGEKMPAKPTDDHKQAFRLRLYSDDLGLRELSSTAKTVVNAMSSLHDKYEAESKANAGKMALVEIVGTTPIKINTPQGELRFKIPDWNIVGWVSPPDAFGLAPEPGAVAQPTSSATADDDDLF